MLCVLPCTVCSCSAAFFLGSEAATLAFGDVVSLANISKIERKCVASSGWRKLRLQLQPRHCFLPLKGFTLVSSASVKTTYRCSQDSRRPCMSKRLPHFLFLIEFLYVETRRLSFRLHPGFSLVFVLWCHFGALRVQDVRPISLCCHFAPFPDLWLVHEKATGPFRWCGQTNHVAPCLFFHHSFHLNHLADCVEHVIACRQWKETRLREPFSLPHTCNLTLNMSCCFVRTKWRASVLLAWQIWKLHCLHSKSTSHTSWSLKVVSS